MAIVFVDTNILVCAVNRASPQHDRAHALVAEFVAGDRAWATTWRVLYEFLRVVTHTRAERPMSIDAALASVGEFLSSPSLSLLIPTSEHHDLLRRTCAEVEGLSGNLLFDVEAAVLMREHGIDQIVTLDADFRRFPFLKVIEPT